MPILSLIRNNDKQVLLLQMQIQHLEYPPEEMFALTSLSENAVIFHQHFKNNGLSLMQTDANSCLYNCSLLVLVFV